VVVLGLVSSKVPELEKKDDLKRRIEAAAKYVPLENLCLSPQCGFSSTPTTATSSPPTISGGSWGCASMWRRASGVDFAVVPAQAGTQGLSQTLDSRLRGNDKTPHLAHHSAPRAVTAHSASTFPLRTQTNRS